MTVLIAILALGLAGVAEAHRIHTSAQIKAHSSASTGANLSASKLRIEVLYIAHGYGCETLVEQPSLLANSSDADSVLQQLDPPLMDCGRAHSARNGEQLRSVLLNREWKPHAILSSTMTRAVETAVAMFPGKVVYPLPFLNDKAYSGLRFSAATPRPLAEQRKFFRGQQVDWQFVVTEDFELKDPRLNKKGNKRFWTGEEARTASTHRAFRAHIGEVLLPALLYCCHRGDGPVRIVVVGHGKMLRNSLNKYFRCQKKLPHNDAVFVSYDYLVKRQKLTETKGEPHADCTSPLQTGPQMKWVKSYLCPKDYQRCRKEGVEFPGDQADNPRGCCVDQ